MKDLSLLMKGICVSGLSTMCCRQLNVAECSVMILTKRRSFRTPNTNNNQVFAEPMRVRLSQLTGVCCFTHQSSLKPDLLSVHRPAMLLTYQKPIHARREAFKRKCSAWLRAPIANVTCKRGGAAAFLAINGRGSLVFRFPL